VIASEDVVLEPSKQDDRLGELLAPQLLNETQV
jgi:hypothetical protein